MASSGKPAINNAGGFAFAVSDMERVRRFLILGTEGGTLYQSERKLTRENAAAIARLIEAGSGDLVLDEIRDVSLNGRASKQGPTLYALAMVTRLGEEALRSAAYKLIKEICRTPTMLFEFLQYHMAMHKPGRGWGGGLRKAIAGMYTDDIMPLVRKTLKYKQRNGMSQRDVLRLAHPKPPTDAHKMLFHYLTTGKMPSIEGAKGSPLFEASRYVVATRVVGSDKCTVETAVRIIKQYSVPRECISSRLLSSPLVWAALLETMGITALVRNLNKMTEVGLFEDKAMEELAVAMLTNGEKIKASRAHPVLFLVARGVYSAGSSPIGSLTWKPNAALVDALGEAFYLAFGNVKPTGKRYVLAMDVSGSMWCANIAGTHTTAAEASFAMASIVLRTEETCHCMAFSDKLVRFPISREDTLEDMVAKARKVKFGGTDCAQPMKEATKNRIEADVFVIYTDSETLFNKVTPAEALRDYRRIMGIDAKLIVVAMTSAGFSIADPKDSGMLDVVGFDTGTPAVMREFVVGGF